MFHLLPRCAWEQSILRLYCCVYRKRTFPIRSSTRNEKGKSMLKANLAARARLIFHPDELNYNFGAEHPLQPRRIAALMDLLETCGLWNSSDERYRLPFRAATYQEFGLVHR